MGYAISWIAFEGKTATEVADLLSLSPSGKFDEVPRDMFSGARLDSGWYVVVIDKYAHKFVRARTLERVSTATGVIAATVEEHVMFSSAEAWKSGRLIWKITHEGENGPRNLKERGSLPAEYSPIKTRLLAAQQEEDAGTREVDYFFDMPLDLAEAITGYKHDKALAARFEILKRGTSTVAGGLFSRLFR